MVSVGQGSAPLVRLSYLLHLPWLFGRFGDEAEFVLQVLSSLSLL